METNCRTFAHLCAFILFLIYEADAQGMGIRKLTLMSFINYKLTQFLFVQIVSHTCFMV